LLQGFNWESWKQSGGWYNMMMGKVDDIAAAGVTHVWLPPPSHSVSNEGFLMFLSLPQINSCLNNRSKQKKWGRNHRSVEWKTC
jgi:hypothetical protein